MLATLHSLITFAATEEGGHAEEEPEGIDLVLPDPAELLWGAVAFVIVATFLMWKIWPRLREAIQNREQQIQGDLEEAEKAKNEANKEREEYQKQLAEARSEANRVIDEARGQAEEVRKDIIEKAQAAA